MFLNVMTPLIMVITFPTACSSPSPRATADQWRAQGAGVQACHRVVGPACVLTHGTAACRSWRCGFRFRPDPLVREAGLIATVIALVTVLTLVPLLACC